MINWLRGLFRQPFLSDQARRHIEALENEIDDQNTWMWDTWGRLIAAEEDLDAMTEALNVVEANELARERELDKVWKKVWEVEDALAALAHKTAGTGSFMSHGLIDELGGTLWTRFAVEQDLDEMEAAQEFQALNESFDLV